MDSDAVGVLLCSHLTCACCPLLCAVPLSIATFLIATSFASISFPFHAAGIAMSAPARPAVAAAAAAAAVGAGGASATSARQPLTTSPSHPEAAAAAAAAAAAESQQAQQQPEQRASAVIAQLLPAGDSAGAAAPATTTTSTLASPTPALAPTPASSSTPLSPAIHRNDSSQELQRSTWVAASSSLTPWSSSGTQTSFSSSSPTDAAASPASPPVPLPYSTPVPVSAADPHLVVRRACAEDFSKGHLALLAQLTTVGRISPQAYVERIRTMHERYAELFHVLVIEDTSLPLLPAAQSTTPPPGGVSDSSVSSAAAAAAPNGSDSSICSIIACATLLVELKLVHGCGAAGHVEDVVVKDGYRGKNLGVRIVQALHDIAIAKGCYKVSKAHRTPTCRSRWPLLLL